MLPQGHKTHDTELHTDPNIAAIMRDRFTVGECDFPQS